MEVFYPNIPWKVDEKEYNCSSKSFTEWKQRGSVDIVQGSYFLVTGTIFLFIYVVALIALVRAKLLKIPCYKLLFFNGLIDILSIVLGSYFVAYFQFDGTVFCSNIPLSQLIGHITWSAWLGSTSSGLVLAFNRLVEMVPPMFSIRFMFRGKLVYMWMIVCLVLMVGRPFLTRPAIYNTAVDAFITTPFISDDMRWEVKHYVSILQPIHNISVVVILVLVYSVICFHVVKVRRLANRSLDFVQVQLFVQVLMICASIATAAGFYTVAVFLPAPEYVVFASVVWQLSQGIPGIVLISLNKRIRGEARNLLMCKRSNRKLLIRPPTRTAAVTPVT